MARLTRAQQVGALPWRKRRGVLEILLVTSRGTGRWVIPKGWPMAHLIASNAAKREAFEEAGVGGTVRRKPIGRYTYNKRVGDDTPWRCVVTVYALEVTREHRGWPERRERTRRWFSLKEAAASVNEAGLRALIRTFAPE